MPTDEQKAYTKYWQGKQGTRIAYSEDEARAWIADMRGTMPLRRLAPYNSTFEQKQRYEIVLNVWHVGNVFVCSTRKSLIEALAELNRKSDIRLVNSEVLDE